MSTRGIIYNGIKYLYLTNPNNLKKISLEDNVYFTLRDIFQNIDDFQFAMESNFFNDTFTNGISYEERTDDFSYSNILNEDFSFVCRLSDWLSYICEYYFEFEIIEENIDLEKYITFDKWLSQLTILREHLNEIINKMSSFLETYKK
jgi:hypothetical protein